MLHLRLCDTSAAYCDVSTETQTLKSCCLCSCHMCSEEEETWRHPERLCAFLIKTERNYNLERKGLASKLESFLKDTVTVKGRQCKTTVFLLSLSPNTENNGRANEDLRTSVLREDGEQYQEGPSHFRLGLLPVSCALTMMRGPSLFPPRCWF